MHVQSRYKSADTSSHDSSTGLPPCSYVFTTWPPIPWILRKALCLQQHALRYLHRLRLLRTTPSSTSPVGTHLSSSSSCWSAYTRHHPSLKMVLISAEPPKRNPGELGRITLVSINERKSRNVPAESLIYAQALSAILCTCFRSFSQQHLLHYLRTRMHIL
jgi:hypothetical protein